MWPLLASGHIFINQFVSCPRLPRFIRQIQHSGLLVIRIRHMNVTATDNALIGQTAHS